MPPAGLGAGLIWPDAMRLDDYTGKVKHSVYFCAEH